MIHASAIASSPTFSREKQLSTIASASAPSVSSPKLIRCSFSWSVDSWMRSLRQLLVARHAQIFAELRVPEAVHEVEQHAAGEIDDEEIASGRARHQRHQQEQA